MSPEHRDNKELDEFLFAIYQCYGYDFRHYARASLLRRIELQLTSLGLVKTKQLQKVLQNDRAAFDQFLQTMSVTVTDLFRNPVFFVKMRENVVPRLKSWYRPKIWSAGCATGEEVYSLVIMLEEEGLSNFQLYATDYNRCSLDAAREGIYPLDRVKQFSTNYFAGGGKGSLADYYYASYDSVKMADRLKGNVVFSHHNLVSDSSFGEMQLIICRNVLIYFDKVLQDQVLTLFSDSLCAGGFLCLGSKESVDFVSVSDRFEPVAKKERIFRKRYET